MSKDENVIQIKSKSSKRLGFNFVSPSMAALNDAPHIEKLVHGWKEGTIAIFAGEGGIGKSTMLLAIASAIASPYQAHDIYKLTTCSKPKRVMFLSGEDDTDTVELRMNNFYNKNDLDSTLVENNLMVTCDVDLFSSLSDENWLWELKNTIVAEAIDVLVIDTWSVFSGIDNENDNAECGKILKSIKTILIGNPKNGESKLSIMIVHHTNSDGGIRGASALKNNARAAYIMRTMNEKEEIKVKGNGFDGTYVALDLHKSNYDKKGILRWFKQVEHGQFELADDEFLVAIDANSVPSSIGLTANTKTKANRIVATKTHEADEAPCGGLTDMPVAKAVKGLFGAKESSSWRNGNAKI